jgi:hypothetical protein
MGAADQIEPRLADCDAAATSQSRIAFRGKPKGLNVV